MYAHTLEKLTERSVAVVIKGKASTSPRRNTIPPRNGRSTPKLFFTVSDRESFSLKILRNKHRESCTGRLFRKIAARFRSDELNHPKFRCHAHCTYTRHFMPAFHPRRKQVYSCQRLVPVSSSRMQCTPPYILRVCFSKF